MAPTGQSSTSQPWPHPQTAQTAHKRSSTSCSPSSQRPVCLEAAAPRIAAVAARQQQQQQQQQQWHQQDQRHDTMAASPSNIFATFHSALPSPAVSSEEGEEEHDSLPTSSLMKSFGLPFGQQRSRTLSDIDEREGLDIEYDNGRRATSSLSSLSSRPSRPGLLATKGATSSSDGFGQLQQSDPALLPCSTTSTPPSTNDLLPRPAFSLLSDRPAPSTSLLASAGAEPPKSSAPCSTDTTISPSTQHSLATPEESRPHMQVEPGLGPSTSAHGNGSSHYGGTTVSTSDVLAPSTQKLMKQSLGEPEGSSTTLSSTSGSLASVTACTGSSTLYERRHQRFQMQDLAADTGADNVTPDSNYAAALQPEAAAFSTSSQSTGSLPSSPRMASCQPEGALKATAPACQAKDCIHLPFEEQTTTRGRSRELNSPASWSGASLGQDSHPSSTSTQIAPLAPLYRLTSLSSLHTSSAKGTGNRGCTVRSASPLRIINKPVSPAKSSPEGTEVAAPRAAVSGRGRSDSVTYLAAPPLAGPVLSRSPGSSDSATTPTASPYSPALGSARSLSSCATSMPSTANTSSPGASAPFGTTIDMYGRRGSQDSAISSLYSACDSDCSKEQSATTGATRASFDATNEPQTGTSFSFSNYDFFIQSCASSDRPPLLRSVSEDAPILAHKRLSGARTIASMAREQARTSQTRDPSYAMDHVKESCDPESLAMHARAFTAAPDYRPAAEASISARSSLKQQHSHNTSSSSIATASTSNLSGHSPPSSLHYNLASQCSSPPTPSSSFASQLSTKQPTQSASMASQMRASKHSSNATLGHSATASLTALPLSRTHQRPFSSTRSAAHRGSIDVTVSSSAPSSAYTSGDRADEDSLYLAAFDPDTAAAIRKAATAVRGHASSLGGVPAEKTSQNASNTGHGVQQQALMGACGNGYFGNSIRAKVAQVLEELLPLTTPREELETIGLAEYGCLNSLSSSLVPRITSHFASTQRETSPSFCVTYADGPGADFRTLSRQVDSASYEFPNHHLNPQIFPSFASRPFAAQVAPSRAISVGFSLMDLHCRKTPVSSGLSAAAAAHNELQAFLNARAVEFEKGGLLVLAFIQRQEDEGVAAVKSAKSKRAGDGEAEAGLGFTSPLHGKAKAGLPHLNFSSAASSLPGPATSTFSPTQAPELSNLSHSRSTSLSSSAMASAASLAMTLSRSRSESSPSRPYFKSNAGRRSDIWSSIPALLAPCIQRLVSTGLIKSDTAHHLLSLPLHPRTPQQTQAVLRAVQHQWRAEWTCGLGDGNEPLLSSPITPTPSSTFAQQSSLQETLDEATKAIRDQPGNEAPLRPVSIREDALTLAHPAYTAFQSTTLSQVQFAEHAVQFIRVLYEAHFRSVLRDYAKLSRSRLEEVLDALNEVLREKIEEPGRAPLALELEICIVALRRL